MKPKIAVRLLKQWYGKFMNETDIRFIGKINIIRLSSYDNKYGYIATEYDRELILIKLGENWKGVKL